MKNLHLKSEVNLKSLSVEKISNVGQACSFIRIETLAHVFSCEFGKIPKNTFSYRTPQVIASVQYYFLRKSRHTQFCKELYQLIQLIEGMLWGCIGVCVQGQPQRKEQYEKIRCQILAKYINPFESCYKQLYCLQLSAGGLYSLLNMKVDFL